MASKRVRIEQGIWKPDDDSRASAGTGDPVQGRHRPGPSRQVIEGGIARPETALAVAVLDRRSGDRRERENRADVRRGRRALAGR